MGSISRPFGSHCIYYYYTYFLFDIDITKFQRDGITVLGFETIDTPCIDCAQQIFVYFIIVHFWFIFAGKQYYSHLKKFLNSDSSIIIIFFKIITMIYCNITSIFIQINNYCLTDLSRISINLIKKVCIILIYCNIILCIEYNISIIYSQ